MHSLVGKCYASYAPYSINFTKATTKSFAVCFFSTQKLEIVSPSTGKIVKVLDADDTSSIHSKFQSVKAAQSKWAETTVDQRKKSIENFSKLLQENQEQLASDLTSETGKPISQSHNEIKATPSRIKFFFG